MNAYKVVGIVCFLLFNGIGAGLYWTALKDAAHADLISKDTTSFTSSGAFMAPATLRSPAGETLKSLHFGTDCVAFGTRVEKHTMTTDSDGDEDESVSQIFEDRNAVSDLVVSFDGGEASLDILGLSPLYGEKLDKLDECPRYVPPEMVPKASGNETWWEIYEASFKPEQKVFVVAQLEEPDSLLKPHPEFDSVILFPGERAGLIRAYQEHGKFQKLGTLILFVMSLIAAAVCALGSKLSQKK